MYAQSIDCSAAFVSPALTLNWLRTSANMPAETYASTVATEKKFYHCTSRIIALNVGFFGVLAELTVGVTY